MSRSLPLGLFAKDAWALRFRGLGAMQIPTTQRPCKGILAWLGGFSLWQVGELSYYSSLHCSFFSVFASRLFRLVCFLCGRMTEKEFHLKGSRSYRRLDWEKHGTYG